MTFEKFTVHIHGTYWILGESIPICPECESDHVEAYNITNTPAGEWRAWFKCTECRCAFYAERKDDDSKG